MIVVYHVPHSRSLRVVWLLEELGIAYETRRLEFKPSALRTEEYLAVHPLGQVPAISDGDVRLYESGAIVQYLLERYGAGRLAPPPGAELRPLYLQWFHFSEASLAAEIGRIVSHRFLKHPDERNPTIVEEARRNLRPICEVLDRALEHNAHLLGADFTAVDIMTGYALSLAKMINELPEGLTNLTSYVDRVTARPAFQLAAAR